MFNSSYHNLNEALRLAITSNLSGIDINFMNDYALGNKEVIGFLYDNKIIDDVSIESALEKAVFNRARKDYDFINLILNRKEYTLYPDQVPRPECLAYALEKDKFSKKEINEIPFDHGENKETFCKCYGIENLLIKLRNELLNPKSPPILDPNKHWDPNPACCSL